MASRLGSILDLPVVLISEVLFRLPVEDIMRCRCVCRIWCDLTREPHVLNNHQCRGTQHLLLQADLEMKEGKIVRNGLFLVKKRNCDDKWMAKKFDQIQGIDVQDMRVKASCNGLLLLFPPKRLSPIYIYNPITRGHLELPKPCQELQKVRHNEFTVGFGFDPVKNLYKVVLTYKLFKRDNQLFQSNGEILSVGESAWRELRFPHKVSTFSSPQLFNGAFHWMINMRDDQILDSDYVILALDIGNEKFEIVKFPPPRSGLDISKQMFQTEKIPLCTHYRPSPYTKVMSLGESLALVWRSAYILPKPIAIRQIFGTESDGRWVYKYSFSVSLANRIMKCEMLGMLSDRCFLTRAYPPFDDGTSQVDNISYPCIALYNPERNESQILDLPGFPKSSEAFSFIPSLVSPSAFKSKFDSI